MTKKRSMTVLVVVLALAVVLTGGLMASNMGFKLNRTLVSATNPGSVSGTQIIALPYNRQVGIDTAQALFQDIGNAQNIQRFLSATDTFELYTFGKTDFPLEPGKAVFVKMGVDKGYIVVGSHDPSAVIQLDAIGAGSNSGTNLYAPPYHATAASARDLFDELGAANVQNIQKFLTATDTYQLYTFGKADFPLVPGEGYFVKMGTSQNYSPSHY